MAWMSILALYNLDETIFDYMVIPTADDINHDVPTVEDPFVPDKDTLISYICMELAELCLVYASPSTMKDMIQVWSRVHLKEWVDLYNSMIWAYNPIWNKDGRRTHTVQGDLHIMTGGSTTSAKIDQSTVSDDKVTGFDSTTPQPYTNTTTRQLGDMDKNQSKFEYNAQTDHADYTETDTEQGNIGVTTTMSMIKEQREIVQFNLYQHITDEFKHQFCVMIY